MDGRMRRELRDVARLTFWIVVQSMGLLVVFLSISWP
jgi:hypothetical protein